MISQYLSSIEGIGRLRHHLAAAVHPRRSSLIAVWPCGRTSGYDRASMERLPLEPPDSSERSTPRR